MKSIRIKLDQETVRPGEEIRGRVEWDMVTQGSPKLWISVLWHTEGKGTEDGQTVDQLAVQQPPTSGSHAFSFRLPPYPWSFSGELISVIWLVEASFETADLMTQQGFIMAPRGREIFLRAVDGD